MLRSPVSVCCLFGGAVLLLGACSSNSDSHLDTGNAGRAGAAGGGSVGSAGSASAGVSGMSQAGSAGASLSGAAGDTAAGGDAASAGSSGAGSMASAGNGGAPGAGGGTQSAGSAGTAASAGGSNFGLAGPSRCATAGVALCEDFENGLDTATWARTQSGDATVVVDEVHAARGTKALHVKTTLGSGHAYITEKKSFPATNNILYGRMFVLLGDAFTTDGHFTLAEGVGAGNSAAIRFGGQNKFFGVGTDGGTSGDWTDKDNKPIPTQTWICTEFQFKSDTNEFHVSVDDIERTTLNRGVKQHAGFAMPAFNSLWFGYWMYNMTEPQELWIDEIAVDFKPIGCAK